MMIAEAEYRELKKLKDWAGISLTKAALECRSAAVSRVPARTLEKLYGKLREAHQTYEAAAAAVELAENFTFGFEPIGEALDTARSEAREKRQRSRDGVVDNFITAMGESWNLPSEFARVLRMLLDEVFAIRDALDPPRAEGIRKILNEMEQHADETS